MSKEKKDFVLENNKGFVFISKLKDAPKDAPKYYGSVCLENTVYKLSGWVKKNDKGSHIALALQPTKLEFKSDTEKQAFFDEWDKKKEEHKKAYLEEKKGSDEYVMFNFTGSLHKTKSGSKNDMFGKVRIDDKYFGLDARVIVTDGAPALHLSLAVGRSEEEREELTNSFID